LISQADKLVLTLHFWSLGFFKEERTDIQALNKGKQAKTGVSLQDVNATLTDDLKSKPMVP
jgi:hypothetical protein